MAEFHVAAYFLLKVMGNEFFETRVKLVSDNPDPWMMNGDDAWLSSHPMGNNEVRRMVYNQRVVRLANALHTLVVKNVNGLDLNEARFRDRDTKSCFLETEIASMLALNGFQVSLVPESGIRGNDFDLSLERNGTVISVEVTAKLDGPLSTETVLNTLRHKRKQVPPDRPAVLYMHIPAEWMRDKVAGFRLFDTVFRRFVFGSRRFNAIGLVWEEMLQFAGGAIGGISMQVYFSNRPRHPYPWTNLFEVPVGIAGIGRMALPLIDDVRKYRERMREREQKQTS